MRVLVQLAAVLPLVAIACSSEPDHHGDPGHGDPTAGDSDRGVDWDRTAWDFHGYNNGALLAGPTVVGGSEANATLVKTVPAALSPADSRFRVTEATVSRATANGPMVFYAMVAVTNVDARPYCFLSVAQVDYLNQAGTVVASVADWPVSGSVGRSGTVWVATCLAPGETGYFCDTQLGDLFAEVARVTVELGVDPDADLHNPTAAVVPLSYTFSAGAGLGLSLRNDGTTAATLLNAMSLYLLLDELDRPLWFHFWRTPGETDLILAPGATATLTDPYITFKGSGVRLRVFVDFTQ